MTQFFKLYASVSFVINNFMIIINQDIRQVKKK